MSIKQLQNTSIFTSGLDIRCNTAHCEDMIIDGNTIMSGNLLLNDNLTVAGTSNLKGQVTFGNGSTNWNVPTERSTLPSRFLQTDGNGNVTWQLMSTDFDTITQATSTTTPVTLNHNYGEVVTFSQSAVAGATDKFIVNNSLVVASDSVHIDINHYAGTYSTNGIPHVNIGSVGAGSFEVHVSNVHPTNALSGALKLRFFIAKTQ